MQFVDQMVFNLILQLYAIVPTISMYIRNNENIWLLHKM